MFNLNNWSVVTQSVEGPE